MRTLEGSAADTRANLGSSRRFLRSRQMADCLRGELLYSEKRPRDMLFRAIERILADRTDAVIVAALTREAATRARHEAQATYLKFDRWDTAAKAVVKAMLGAGVLLGPGGDPIRPGITAGASAVAALHERYRDLTEAFLIEFVIQRLGNVTTRDHMALAHALFRQFDPRVPITDMEDRMVILLAQLADRIDLDGDTYVVRGGPSQ